MFRSFLVKLIAQLQFKHFFLYLFIYFWLCWVFVAACGHFLVAETRGYSPVVVYRLLTVVASLVEPGL